jgi:hypothetical protein
LGSLEMSCLAFAENEKYVASDKRNASII